MSFGTVMSSYTMLKKRLSILVESQVLADITVETPKGTDDELSFIRLVSWAYVLIHESGKVPLDFLKQLPPLNESGRVLPYVRVLRTWTSHNLSLDKTTDLKTMKEAVTWFRRTCGVGSPADPNQWGKCFSQLCDDLSSLLAGAVSACDNLEVETDGARLVQELKSRIDRQWEAYRFDSYVSNAIDLLGFTGIDVVAFRKRHLDSWRKVVSVAQDSDIDRLISLRIEADLLKMMADALPISAKELSNKLVFTEPDDLAAAMFVIQAQRTEGGSSLPELLKLIFEKVPPSNLALPQNLWATDSIKEA